MAERGRSETMAEKQEERQWEREHEREEREFRLKQLFTYTQIFDK